MIRTHSHMNWRENVRLLDVRGHEVLGWLRRYRYWLVVPAILFLAAAAWRYAPTLRLLLIDPSAVEALVLELGWYGPLALVAINALQIVFAPIPGYVVQVAAGFLFGPLWGGIWGSLGMLVGATIAFWLARIFGRPLAEALVGRGRLDKWETTTHSTSTAVWFLLLLGPTGDVPYFLAGLSSVRYLKILLITVLLRVPAVFLAAAAGGRALPFWQVALIYAVLAAMAGLFLLNQGRLQHWMEKRSGGEQPRVPMDSLSMDLNQEKT